MMVDFGTDPPTFEAPGNDAGSVGRSKTGLLLSIVVSAGLGVLGGFLIGRKVGEVRGLAVGVELGRLEAAAARPQPRPWRRFWRRPAAG